MSADLRTLLLDTTPDEVPDLDVDLLVRRGARRRQAKRVGAAAAVLAVLTVGSIAVLGPMTEGRLPVIGQDPPAVEVPAEAWSRLPDAPMGPRERATVATDGDLVALFGGQRDEAPDGGETTYGSYTATDGAIYDAASDVWLAVPPAPMSPRAGANVELAGGQLLVVGGIELIPVTGGGVLVEEAPTEAASRGPGDPPFEHGRPLTLESARFDLTARSWRPMGAPDIAARSPEVVTWDGERLVLWGGSGDADEPWMDGATWTEDGGWTTIPAAPLDPRTGAAVAVAGDRLVVWGGTREQDSPRAADLLDDGAVFDLDSGEWTALPEGPLAPRWIGHGEWPNRQNVRVDGDRILIVGGATTGTGQAHDGAWLDLRDLSWAPITPAPEEARFVTARPGGVLAVDDDVTDADPYVTLWRYDEDRDEWDRSATHLRTNLEIHDLSPERILVSSDGQNGHWQDAPRLGIWDADSARVVHTHPPLSGRMQATIAPLSDGALVWGGRAIEVRRGEYVDARAVSDGARLDR